MPYQFLLITLISLLVGCHTIQGLGDDIAKGGQAISHAATKDSKDL